MTITSVYPGVDQPDSASVTVNGVTFTCHVWTRPGQLAIVADIYRELEDGGHALVDGPVIVAAESDRAYAVESPKVVGRLDGGDGHFILHYLRTETAGTGCTIHRYRFDLQGFSAGWQYEGQVATTHPAALYDVCEVEGSDSDYILAHKNVSGTEISIGRWYAWDPIISPQWLETHTLECEDRILGVYANDNIGIDGGTVMVTRQALDSGLTPKELYTFRVDAGNGTGHVADEPVMLQTQMPDDTGAEYLQVRHALMSEAGFGEVAVLVEAQTIQDQSAAGDGISGYGRWLAWTLIDRDAASIAPVQWLPGVSLVTAWGYASGLALTRNLYAAVSFKTLADDWTQQIGLVLDLDYLATAAAASDGSVEPKPVATFNDGTFDGRVSGYHPAPSILSGADLGGVSNGIMKRVNHTPHVVAPPQYSLGPKRKTVSFVHTAWEAIMPTPDGLNPTRAGVREYEFHHEDPWMHRRDDSEPAVSSTQNLNVCAPWSIGKATDLGEFMHFSGGVQHVYAGRTLVELGFLWSPELIDVSLNGSPAPANTFEADGTYYYTYTYAWPDEHGHIHRSQPAPPVALVQAATPEEVEVTMRAMTVSMKDRAGSDRPISLELWRTYFEDGATAESGGTYLFRRVFCEPGLSGAGQVVGETPINDRTYWGQTVVDAQTDSNIALAELLPWQLDPNTLTWNLAIPVPPPACTVACVWNNRLWVVPSEHQDQIWYTNEILPIGAQQGAPEFNDFNIFRFDNRGPITAMVPMDNRLIVFTRDGAFALVGDGNDLTGANATLQMEVLADGVGCIEPRSVVLIPAIGILFQSARGIYAFTRETGITYIGADVEDIIREAGNVRAATLLENRHQVKLAINRAPTASDVDPTVLTYDYLRKMWFEGDVAEVGSASTERLNEMQAGCAWRGQAGETLHVFLQSGGLAVERAESDTAFSDTSHTATVAVPLDVTTSWISLAGLGGLKRVKEIQIATTRHNAGEMSVDFWYDIDGSFDDSVAPETFVFASPASDKLVIRPAAQKYTSFKLRVYESGTVPQTENVRITAITALAASKRGLTKVAATQKGVS